jgi:hypothetical protein
MNKQSDKIVAKFHVKGNKKARQLLEDFLLIEKIKENKKEDYLELNEGKSFYHHLNLLNSNS